MGTTGSSAEKAVNVELPNILSRVRQYAKVPLAVGFGVATREHFEIVANAGSDGVVIGSRLVSLIRNAPKETLFDDVRNYCKEVSQKGRPIPPKKAVDGDIGHISQPETETAPLKPPAPNAPDQDVLPARFGEFGGQYVPEALVDCLVELEQAHKDACADPEFWKEFESFYGYMNRPSKLYLAERLTEHVGGAKIWFKREDL
jgi:tryptophan synthase